MKELGYEQASVELGCQALRAADVVNKISQIIVTHDFVAKSRTGDWVVPISI